MNLLKPSPVPWVATLSFALVACVGTVATTSDAGLHDAAPPGDANPPPADAPPADAPLVYDAPPGADVQPLVDAFADAAPSSVCPAAPPTVGAACSIADIFVECEYGADPSWTCDAVFVCAGNAWKDISSGVPCSTANPAGCPSDVSSVASGASCSLQVRCAVGRCSCAPQCNGNPAFCDAAAPSIWSCEVNRPRLGTPCAREGATWLAYFCGPEEYCKGGVWEMYPNAC